VSEVGSRQVWRRTTSEKSPSLALHVETRRAMVLGVEIWSGAEARGGARGIADLKFEISEGAGETRRWNHR
jgi:hypothetical protein